MKVFVDTNILIDFICNRDEFYDDAETVFAYGLSGLTSVSITDISIINTLYVGKRYGYTVEELSNLLSETLSYCNLSIIDSNVILNALNSIWKDKEDATQYYAAKESMADIIITRNVKDFQLSDIPVMTPKEFIKQVQ